VGLITLVGLISKHGILMLDFARRLQERGVPFPEAIIAAAAVRRCRRFNWIHWFRPAHDVCCGSPEIIALGQFELLLSWCSNCTVHPPGARARGTALSQPEME